MRLDHLVHAGEAGVGPFLPEGGDVADDDAGVAPGEAVVVEAELGSEPRAEVREDNVRPGKERIKDVGRALVAEGEGREWVPRLRARKWRVTSPQR